MTSDPQAALVVALIGIAVGVVGVVLGSLAFVRMSRLQRSYGLLQAADAGCTAVIQPGGSVRDNEVIAAADERGVAMVFTGVRVFRH